MGKDFRVRPEYASDAYMDYEDRQDMDDHFGLRFQVDRERDRNKKKQAIREARRAREREEFHWED